MTAAALNGYASSAGRVQLPAYGVWWADVTLQEDVVLTGAVTLTVLDATLVGTVVHGGVVEGRAAYRIAGGAGGWGITVSAKLYADDLGVKLASVLGDAAALAGESLTGAPATRAGPRYARSAGPASRVLHDLVPRTWYVGLDGLTHFGARPTGTYAGDAPRTRVDAIGQIVELAVDDAIAALVPGVVVDGAEPATDVEWSWGDGARLTARVYSGAQPARRLDAWRQIADALDPRRAYRGLAEYRVVSQTAEKLNLQIVRTATGLPDLVGVSYRGAPGVRATVTLGSLVLVAFADADPSRPFVVAHACAGDPGWSPSMLELGDTGGSAVALASVVDANFAALRALFLGDPTAVPPILPWVPVPPDGGASLLTKVTAEWSTAFAATGSSKVKAAL